MRKIFIYLLFIFLQNFQVFTVKAMDLTFENIPYKKSIKNSVIDGEIFSESTVSSFETNKQKMQSLNFSIMGLHKKECRYALKTLSSYENYSKYIDFISESNYDESSKTLSFRLSHMLLPFDMMLIFQLPRIDTVGTYPFSFEIGFLKGLKGNINVLTYNNRCLFYSTAKWTGLDTGLNNTIFEVFSQALSKISMETLFRISSTLSHK